MKKFFILLILLLTTIFTIPIVQVDAATATSLTIHYRRYDQQYTEWSLWLWAPGQDGSDYFFTSNNSYGTSATISLTGNLSGISEIGIIVKKGVGSSTWVKDVSQDRYINLTQPNGSGHVDAYVLEGVPFISYVSEDTLLCNRETSTPDPYQCAQDLSPRIVKSNFNSLEQIEFQISQTITASQLTVTKNDIPVTYTGFTGGTMGTITLTEPIDTNSIYMLNIESDTFSDQSMITFGVDYDSTLFAEAYHFDGWLGHKHQNAETTFRVWAPVSSKVSINLYTKGHRTTVRSDGVNTPYLTQEMTYIGKGVWEITILGDLHGIYYTFNVTNNGALISDIADPYGVSYGLNGLRSMVVDFQRVNPEGWDIDQGVKGYDSINDWTIYELHVRDLTSHSSWNGPESYRGKFMGLTVTGTSYTHPVSGITVSTGLDHLKELGITHLHLLPTYDQDGYNNEANFQFNWGYNPQNFNSPEGGYSTDPFDGAVRVNEFKRMVQALHSNGINIILDKVYNHTSNTNFTMDRIVPGYIYRFDSNGNYSNGTGVGNETASERYMFRKFMIDSAVFWAEEYHIDGLRFDLMAVHDKDTMNMLTDAVKTVNPEIQVYGEPWGGGTIQLPYNLQAGKNNLSNMPLISAFNDQFRDTIKGSTFTDTGPGYITNGNGVSDIKKGIVGSTNWGWGLTSSQSVNYISAHDNLTLFDKLLKVNNSTVYTKSIDYQARLGNSIVLLSQGVPFLHAGVDFLRTKGGNHNSYEAPDAVNQLNWIRKSLYTESFEYYKGMIELRKTYDSFKMINPADISSHLSFFNLSSTGLLGYQLTKNSENILVYHNSNFQNNEIVLPNGAWKLLANRDQVDLDGIATYASNFPIRRAETLVFVEGNSTDVIQSPGLAPEITNAIKTVFNTSNVTIRTTTNAVAYQINGNDYIELDIPTTTIVIGILDVGTYTIKVKNSNGEESEPFILTVINNPNPLVPPVVTSEKSEFFMGDIIEITSSVNIIKYKLNDGELVSLNEPTTAINLIGLAVGTYEIILVDVENIESEPFIFSVLESNEEPTGPTNGLPVYAYILIGGFVTMIPVGVFLIKRKRLH